MKKDFIIRFLKIALVLVSILGIIGCIAALLPETQRLIIKFAEDYIRGRPLEPHLIAKWLPVITSYAQSGLFLLLFACICLFVLPSKAGAFFVKAIKTKPYHFLILCVLVLELIFFRNIIGNPDTLIGSDGDARLVNLILEHWYKVFTFKAESISAVPYFAPVKSTLGFTDTFFIYAIPYTLFRLIGFDWMSAGQILWIAVHLFGGITLAILLKKYLNLPLYAVFAGIVIGNYSNAYYLDTVHPQLFSLSLLPLVSIFIYEFYRTFEIKYKRIFYASTVIVSFALLAFSTFYMAYFFALFLIIVHIVFAVYMIKTKKNIISSLHIILKLHIKEIIFYVVLCAVSLLPFLLTYLPAMKEKPGVSMGMLLTTPQYFTLFNVSPTNILWGFPWVESEQGTEAVTGFPFITLLLAILGIAACIAQKHKDTPLPPINIALFCAALSVCIMEVLVIRFNNNFSFWFFVNRLIPGASVLRALSRINLFIAFPLALIIAFFLREKIESIQNKKIKCFAAFTLCLFIFVEHQNLARIANWKKSECTQYLARVSSPPADCRYFVLIDKRHTREEDAFEKFYKDANLDAFMIAAMYNLKTINGYSGFDPKDWTQPFDDIEGMTGLKNWIDKYGLQGVYIYEVSQNIWYLFKL